MHLEYKVTLPDHNFVVGPLHTLIPSIYGVCNITPKGEVSYSSDTFIRIRSGKHDSSSAYTHAYDMRELFCCNNIPQKPILMISTDGGQDEAPRFPKTLSTANIYFKVTRQQAAMIKLVPRPRILQLIIGVTLQRKQEHPSLFTRQM